MERRVELDEALSPARLPGRVLNELYAHAREAQPEECCGLILGDPEQRFARVVRCQNDMTLQHEQDPASFPRTNLNGFYLNPKDQLAVELAIETSGERVTAIYHSHVNTTDADGLYLSKLDLEYAAHSPWPQAAHIVIAVCDGKVTGAGIFERPEGGTFRGRRLEPAP